MIDYLILLSLQFIFLILHKLLHTPRRDIKLFWLKIKSENFFLDGALRYFANIYLRFLIDKDLRVASKLKSRVSLKTVFTMAWSSDEVKFGARVRVVVIIRQWNDWLCATDPFGNAVSLFLLRGGASTNSAESKVLRVHTRHWEAIITVSLVIEHLNCIIAVVNAGKCELLANREARSFDLRTGEVSNALEFRLCIELAVESLSHHSKAPTAGEGFRFAIVWLVPEEFAAKWVIKHYHVIINDWVLVHPMGV